MESILTKRTESHESKKGINELNVQIKKGKKENVSQKSTLHRETIGSLLLLYSAKALLLFLLSLSIYS